jgi:SAM-dependent methyltransferase
LSHTDNNPMAYHVCPWWVGYLLITPLRRLFESPTKVLAPHVAEGMTVLEPGPGMGFFTLELARLVGETGRVIAVELQAKMLSRLTRRAAKAKLLRRIDARLAQPDRLGTADLKGQVDFVFVCHVVHELPSAATFFVEVVDAMRQGAMLLLIEPRGHVSLGQFDKELQAASVAGLTVTARPTIARRHAALLAK